MYGAGVCCADDTARLTSCVISNNLGYSRVGLYQGSAYRCRIVGNRAVAPSDGHPGSVSASLDTCFVAGNEGGYNVSVISGAGDCSIRNCTIGPRAKGAHSLWMKNVKGKVNSVVNTLFFNGAVACSHTVSNCVFASEECNVMRDSEESLMAGNIYGDTSADSEGRPLWGCAAIDAGDVSMASAESLRCDLSGGQRIYGGCIDVGCYEFDWRPRFAAAIGDSRSVSVQSASPEVMTNATGGVRVPAGAGFGLRIAGRQGGVLSFSAAAAGDAVMTAEWNGAVVSSVNAADGEKTVQADVSQSENGLLFSCTGDSGWGVVGNMSLTLGMMLIFR